MILADVDLQAWFFFFARHLLEVALALAVLIGAVLAWIRVVAKPQVRLPAELVGAIGTTLTEVSGLEGRVDVGGKEIRAIAESKIGIGSRVRVVEVDGFIARVAPDAT